VQSVGLSECLVFSENQDHRKQAHACGDNDEGENYAAAQILQLGSPLDSPGICGADRYPCHQHDYDCIDVPNRDEVGEWRLPMLREEQESEERENESNPLSDMGIQVTDAMQK
jgi:hypothetical protein